MRDKRIIIISSILMVNVVFSNSFQLFDLFPSTDDENRQQKDKVKILENGMANILDVFDQASDLLASSFQKFPLSDNNDNYESQVPSEKEISPLTGTFNKLWGNVLQNFNGLNDLLNVASSNDDKEYPLVGEGDRKKQIVVENNLIFCKNKPRICAYVQCLGGNFINSKDAKNFKMAEPLFTDPFLREEFMKNPDLMQFACDQGQLTEKECWLFKNFLSLVNLMDPIKAHLDDEPREKRSAVPKVDSAKSAAKKAGLSDYPDYDSYYSGGFSDNGKNNVSDKEDSTSLVFISQNCTVFLDPNFYVNATDYELSNTTVASNETDIDLFDLFVGH